MRLATGYDETLSDWLVLGHLYTLIGLPLFPVHPLAAGMFLLPGWIVLGINGWHIGRFRLVPPAVSALLAALPLGMGLVALHYIPWRLYGPGPRGFDVLPPKD
jgi:hypothetical protein